MMPTSSEFVKVNGVPLRVDSWGELLPSDVQKDAQKKPKKLILVLPGNPGVTPFYHDFLTRLHNKTKEPIWILSHGGHDKGVKDLPPLKDNEELYNLRGQTEQKIKFIESYLKDVELILVGHSIGCKMILDVLKSNSNNINIKKCYLLFPTIERMAESPNGKRFIFLSRYFLWCALVGALVFTKLPMLIQNALLQIYFWVCRVPDSNRDGVLGLIDPSVIRQCIFLASDEMENVKELDHAVISKKCDKLMFYYGSSDGWVPLSYFEDLKNRYKFIQAEVCSHGFDHAFVLKNSEGMANVLSKWIIE